MSAFFPEEGQEMASLEWSNLRDAVDGLSDARCPVDVTPVPLDWYRPIVLEDPWRISQQRARSISLEEAFP